MKDKLRKDMGARLREIRSALDLSQEGMAAYLSVGRSYYGQCERGENFPGILMLYTLHNVHYVSMDWLVANRGPMFYQGPRASKTPGPGEELLPEEKQLLEHMRQVPLVRYMVMGYYQRLLVENKGSLENSKQLS